MPNSKQSLAITEIVGGLLQWRLWTLLAWQDIVQRYRRSFLGPFWLTLSMGIMVGTLGFLYGQLFKLDIPDYLPFLTLGFLVWGLISGIIADGTYVFISAENFIKQIKIPYLTFVFRIICRNFIIFGHNFVIYVGVALLFDVRPGAWGLLAVPALALITVNSVWVALLLGLVCTRFRDVPQIVASLLQVAFFLTPIIWKPELLSGRVLLIAGNPFFHFLELVRAPLLGQPPQALSWLVAVVLAVVGNAGTYLFFQRYRNRLAYWL